MPHSHEPDLLVDFGFQQVTPREKTERVTAVFTSVAKKYDLMNDLMSAGIHRLWKWIAVHLSNIREDAQILDLAGGTGDLTRLLIKRLGETGHIYLLDINPAMLQEGRNRLINQGYCQRIYYVQGNAEHLPLTSQKLDHIIIGFGLRNVTHKEKALRDMYRVLKPGGCLLVLEFSKPLYGWLSTLYDQYSFKILPWLGKYVADDEASYRYLAESIRQHPEQAALQTMIIQAGFDHCDVYNLTGGIVAIHKAYKY